MQRQRLTEIIQLRLTPRVFQRLEELADEADTTRSDVLRRLIFDHTRRGERPPQVRSEMTKTHTTGTVAEALAVSIRVFQEVIETVDPGAALGFVLSMVKRILQKVAQGLPADRDDVLSIAGALKRAQGGSP